MSSQTRLFVGGIHSEVSEETLKKSFSKFGKVVLCELKKKSPDADAQFAFITISTDQKNIESCINHFSQSEWQGSQLYVTRARESFLERLQKERHQAQTSKKPEIEYKVPENCDGEFKIKSAASTIKSLNIKKPGEDRINGYHNGVTREEKTKKFKLESDTGKQESTGDEKKEKSDKKRLESMRKMRQKFNEKKLLIKSGLAGVDKTSNRKIKFEDDEESTNYQEHHIESELQNGKASQDLFDNDEDDDDDVNFNIKEQFEGKKGQKVLELQSRFKSDKRFVLDERFIDDGEDNGDEDESVQVPNEEEKARQLDILQNVLGVAIKGTHSQPKIQHDGKKTKTKMGMLRFDPHQPEHAKFLAPKEEGEPAQKKKKTKKKQEEQHPEREIEKVEVSKEQFYKVSDTLKEVIAQPNSFSLRSLFSKGKQQEDEEEEKSQNTGYTPLPEVKKIKAKNPLDTSSKNPFKYDSSDSESESEVKDSVTEVQDSGASNLNTAVWRENLFFTANDNRLKDGLAFFNSQTSGNKERRELKSLVKKRLYNRARKDTMFKKKIGGKRKNFSKHRRQK